MNTMVVAVFDNEPGAFTGLQALQDLHSDGVITLYATAVLLKDAAGLVRVTQTSDAGPLGTAIGMLTGSLTGVLAGEGVAVSGLAAGSVAGPLGAAVGVSLGALAGLLVDLFHADGNGAFVDAVSKALLPGKAAVLAEVEETWQTPVDTAVWSLGGLVFRHLRSDVVEDQLAREAAAVEAELDTLADELARAAAERKGDLRKNIGAAKQKLEQTHAQALAWQQQLTREADAKITALLAQGKQAHGRRKAEIEQRTAAVKTAYHARRAKLEQARQFIKDVLTV